MLMFYLRMLSHVLSYSLLSVHLSFSQHNVAHITVHIFDYCLRLNSRISMNIRLISFLTHSFLEVLRFTVLGVGEC